MPSVTTIVGRYFPERAAFQLVAAITGGIRFTVVVIWYLLIRPDPIDSSSDLSKFNSRVPVLVFSVGLLRAFALGGLIYIPVVDDHDMHDFCLTVYLSLTLVWFFSLIQLTKRAGNGVSSMYRRRIAMGYCVLFVPLLHYFTQHKLYQVAGAYSKYAVFEWIALALDLGFDLVAVVEFEGLEIRVYAVDGGLGLRNSKGKGVELHALGRGHYV